MYFVDTAIWLERLLDQKRSAEVRQFLGQTPTNQLLMKLETQLASLKHTSEVIL
jgi:hypothetical protein